MFLFLDALVNILALILVFAKSGKYATTQEKDALFILSLAGVLALIFVREYANTSYIVTSDAIMIRSWFRTKKIALDTLINITHQTTTRVYGATLPIMKGGGHIILTTKTGVSAVLKEVCDSENTIKKLWQYIKPAAKTKTTSRNAKK